MTLGGLYCSKELKETNCGLEIGNNRKVTALAYADDIVLLAKDPSELTKLLDCLHPWCTNWHILINANKTKVVHFRRKNVKVCDMTFSVGGEKLETVKSYKYLGVNMNSSLDLDATVNILAKAGSRALGYIISKCKANIDVGFGTFNKLYNSCVVPILDYGSGAWHLGAKTPKLDQIQQCASCFYMGLPKNCSLLAI